MADVAQQPRDRWRGGIGDARDAVLAAVVGVFVVLTTALESLAPIAFRGVPALGWLLMVVGSAALAWRRRFPVTVGVVTLVASMIYYPAVNPDGALLVTPLIALYTVAATGRLAAAVVLGAVAAVGTGLGELGTEADPLGDAGLFLLISWLVAVVAVGGVAYTRERGRDEALRNRATEERLRIARELHDVLGHNISLINVQAGAALHGLARDPGPSSSELATEALTAIKDTSREALRELRATLGVLRQVDDTAPTAPAPGLRTLEALVERTRAVGLDVDLHTAGDPVPLPPAVDVAAYRIVQEALTNVTRHARAGAVVVRVGYGRDDVTVDVQDDGRGGPVGAGSGIEGMRARAGALGGTLSAGERLEGGFRVTACIPYREAGR
ncbi:sensor histidine kinase [Jiangella asiatica]|uniref:histidine kinase n=1 Tax=Jiangella asiatica TaxID=2530372 RepID=A0A4R5CGA3_9ACTN|nr:histidine kinase [Jiangella asiatica]TDD98079.1 sensor histidine kinase [Jiangella asiatica]